MQKCLIIADDFVDFKHSVSAHWECQHIIVYLHSFQTPADSDTLLLLTELVHDLDLALPAGPFAHAAQLPVTLLRNLSRFCFSSSLHMLQIERPAFIRAA